MTMIKIEFYSERSGEYEIMKVTKDDYIRAKAKDLKQGGYSTLTEDHVREQLEMALSGEGELDIIGRFIDGDLVKDAEPE